MNNDGPRLTPAPRRRLQLSLPAALASAIGVALLIVAASYSLYWNNSNRKYDIARPGKPSENQALTIEDAEVDPTKPVDSLAAQQKIDYLNQEVNALHGMDNFAVDDLSDQNLGLVPSDQPSL